MTAFLILTEDDKYGTVDPRVIGPFKDRAEAEEFQRLDPGWNDAAGIREPVDGGYAGSTIADAETAENPADVRVEWTEQ